MAVQQNKKSHSKVRMHRSKDFLKSPAVSLDSLKKKIHRRHYMTENNLYGFKKIIIKK